MLEIGLIQYAMQKAVSKVCVMYGSYCTCVCVCVCVCDVYRGFTLSLLLMLSRIL